MVKTNLCYELPRECLHSLQLEKVSRRLKDAEAEIERQRGFAMRLADKLHAAAECLAKAAERNGCGEFRERLEGFLRMEGAK